MIETDGGRIGVFADRDAVQTLGGDDPQAEYLAASLSGNAVADPAAELADQLAQSEEAEQWFAAYLLDEQLQEPQNQLL
jgi:hypothetical protein